VPLTLIIVVDIFRVWGIDFVGPLSDSIGKKYILVCGLHVPSGLRQCPQGKISLDGS